MEHPYGKEYVKVMPDDLESAVELKIQYGSNAPLWVVSYEDAHKTIGKEDYANQD